MLLTLIFSKGSSPFIWKCLLSFSIGWGCVKVWDIWRADRRTDKFGSRVGFRSPRAKSKFTQLAQWSKRRAKSKAYAASLEISSSGLWLLCSSHTRLSPLFPLFSHTIQCTHVLTGPVKTVCSWDVSHLPRGEQCEIADQHTSDKRWAFPVLHHREIKIGVSGDFSWELHSILFHSTGTPRVKILMVCVVVNQTDQPD